MAEEIYELCDASDDERYFTLGLFKTFIEAVNVIALADKSQSSVSDSGADNDVETLEIRRREFGLTDGTGKKVYECTREWYYHEDTDEKYWKTVKAWANTHE